LQKDACKASAQLLLRAAAIVFHVDGDKPNITSFMSKNIMLLPNWADWDSTFDKQLDTHDKAGPATLLLLFPTCLVLTVVALYILRHLEQFSQT
jgi:hypothetical protein